METTRKVGGLVGAYAPNFGLMAADRAQAQRIAEIRERRGLSQEDVARRVGVTTSGYQKWELGGGIRGQNLRRLADVFEVSLEQITVSNENQTNVYRRAPN